MGKRRNWSWNNPRKVLCIDFQFEAFMFSKIGNKLGHNERKSWYFHSQTQKFSDATKFFQFVAGYSRSLRRKEPFKQYIWVYLLAILLERTHEKKKTQQYNCLRHCQTNTPFKRWCFSREEAFNKERERSMGKTAVNNFHRANGEQWAVLNLSKTTLALVSWVIVPIKKLS